MLSLSTARALQLVREALDQRTLLRVGQFVLGDVVRRSVRALHRFFEQLAAHTVALAVELALGVCDDARRIFFGARAFVHEEALRLGARGRACARNPAWPFPPLVWRLPRFSRRGRDRSALPQPRDSALPDARRALP